MTKDENIKLVKDLARKLKVKVSFNVEDQIDPIEEPDPKDIKTLQNEWDRLKKLVRFKELVHTNGILTQKLIIQMQSPWDCDIYVDVEDVWFNKVKSSDKVLQKFIKHVLNYNDPWDAIEYYNDDFSKLLKEDKEWKEAQTLVENFNRLVNNIQQKYKKIQVLDYIKE